MDQLTRKDCESVLKKFLRSSDFILESFTITPFRHQGEGLLGEHYTLHVAYIYENETRSREFFVKNLNENNATMFEITKNMRCYDKEEFFYTLLEDYRKLNLDVDFAPKGYFFKPYTIVLEDLGVEYSTVKKRCFMNVEQSKKALETLARFHASTISYEAKSGSVLQKHGNILSDSFQKEYIQTFCNALQQAICDELEMENKEEFIKSIQEVLSRENLLTPDDEEIPIIKTIVHCDLWLANFLFKYDKNGHITGCKLIDYQTIKYGVLQLDVVQFIMSTTRKQFRDEFYRELVEFYYDSLIEFCDVVAHQGITRDEFVQSCQHFWLPAKFLATVDRSLTFLPDGTWMEVLADEELFPKFLREERGKYVVDAFRTDSYYRDLMKEDLSELKDLLSKRIH